MSKHTKNSLGKLSQEELQLIATDLVIKFQENDTKEMLINSILYVQLTADYEVLKTELKEFKAQPNELLTELKEANTVINGQSIKINELEDQLGALTQKPEEKKSKKEITYIKIGSDTITLNPKLKEVLLDGKAYTREEALDDRDVMKKLVSNNYTHLVKK